ncbi:hypothetical protein [Pelomonas sp. Root1444]|uniref:hypothetical protein n=1 Tax=Pelomonas sp. Root1444 TaxID=1736464 RepID=UPI00070346DB|nr:hypothetical protein [Pelomonas sp. Root1444]KQY88282.1 hypothetical protein ASD35_11875 [Pelomonas sp. Root1444]
MLLNLNEPESIVAWWKVFPERHDGFLNYKLSVSPEFAPAIREAQRRIAASSELRDLQAESVRQRRQHEALWAERDDRLTARQLHQRELATA